MLWGSTVCALASFKPLAGLDSYDWAIQTVGEGGNRGGGESHDDGIVTKPEQLYIL